MFFKHVSKNFWTSVTPAFWTSITLFKVNPEPNNNIYMHCLWQHGILWMVFCLHDLVRGVFREQPYYCLNMILIFLLKRETSLTEKPQCGLNVAFDSQVRRSCDKIVDIIKLETTLWLWCVLFGIATVVFRPFRALLMQSAPKSNLEQICAQICSKHRW